MPTMITPGELFPQGAKRCAGSGVASHHDGLAALRQKRFRDRRAEGKDLFSRALPVRHVRIIAEIEQALRGGAPV
jgi:hypothetical protein